LGEAKLLRDLQRNEVSLRFRNPLDFENSKKLRFLRILFLGMILVENDWEFGLLFITGLALLPFSQYVSIAGIVAVFLAMNYLKKN